MFGRRGVRAAAAIAATLMIPGEEIDDDLARGMDHAEDQAGGADQPSGFAALLQNRHLMLFAGLCATFHLANAAMLPSVGQLLTKISGKDHATSLIAVCIVAAQLVMVPVAVFVGARADAIGRKPIFLAAFGFLAIRCGLYVG